MTCQGALAVPVRFDFDESLKPKSPETAPEARLTPHFPQTPPSQAPYISAQKE